MTNKFLRHDGTNWNLDQGVAGPPGPVGLTGPEGPVGPAGAAGNSYVVYRPGVITQPPAYGTWQEVVNAIGLLIGPESTPITVIFDDNSNPCVIPAGDWNIGQFTTFMGSPLEADDLRTLISIQDGCQFDNSPVSFVDVAVECNCVSFPVVSFVPPSFRLELHNSTLKSIVDIGGLPVYQIGNTMIVYLYDGSALLSSSFRAISTGSNLNIYFYNGTVAAGVLGASNINYYINSSADRPDINQTPQATIINDFDNGNLDLIGRYSYGGTFSKPDVTGLPPGYRYFDTDIGTLVVWNGNNWIPLGVPIQSDIILYSWAGTVGFISPGDGTVNFGYVNTASINPPPGRSIAYTLYMVAQGFTRLNLYEKSSTGTGGVENLIASVDNNSNSTGPNLVSTPVNFTTNPYTGMVRLEHIGLSQASLVPYYAVLIANIV